MRFRLAAGSAVALSLVALLCAGQARAAAEVHRLSLFLSASPTQIVGGDINDAIDTYNNTKLNPAGLDPLPHLQFTWAYDSELRYFVRPNFAIAAGVSQIRADNKKEFLPAIGQSVDIDTQLLTVPVHVGAAYYLQPYNQGDFQARMFFGAGLMQYTYTRAMFLVNTVLADTTASANSKTMYTQDSPGYYLEGGGHMFFASHWSVLISVMYRSGKLRNAQLDEKVLGGQEQSLQPGVAYTTLNSHGQPYGLDVGGVGVRFAAGYGF